MVKKTKIIKILLVDDDEADCLLFSKKINTIDAGIQFEIETVHAYEEALCIIEQARHDIYFIDYTLGLQTGMELIDDGFACGNRGPYILLTGMDRPDLYQKSSELGVFEYLLKNEITSSTLLRTVTYTIERRKIENELIFEKELISNIIRDVPYIFMRIDFAGFIQQVNPAFSSITGYDNGEAIHKNWVEFIDSADWDKVKQYLDNQSAQPFKTDILCKDGHHKTIEWTIVFSNDESLSLSVIGKDLTAEMHEAEQARQQSKMQALGHLAGGVAHEINNLLQPISLNAEYIADLDNMDDVKNAAGDILQNANIAASIVEDVLIFARQDNHKLEAINIVETFQEAMQSVSAMMPEGIEVQSNIKIDDATHCMLRLQDMVRVLSNLTLNAAHAMDKSGTVYIAMDNHHDDEGHCVKLTVQDSGHGIKPDDLETIFNPFFTTKDIGEGTGLGLSMVYNIIQNWHGSINVESQLGQGSTFTILVPVLENK